MSGVYLKIIKIKHYFPLPIAVSTRAISLRSSLPSRTFFAFPPDIAKRKLRRASRLSASVFTSSPADIFITCCISFFFIKSKYLASGNDFCLYRQFRSRLAERLMRLGRRKPINLKQNPSRLHLKTVPLRIALTFAHADLRRLLRVGPVRKNTNPDFSGLARRAAHHLSRRLKLIPAHARLRHRLQPERAEGKFRSSRLHKGAVWVPPARVPLSEFYFFGKHIISTQIHKWTRMTLMETPLFV